MTWYDQFVIIIFLGFPVLTLHSIIQNGLNGAHFLVSAHHFPPYQFLSYVPDANGGSNKSLVYSGSTPNIIYWMAEKFNFTYNLVAVDDLETAQYGSVQAGLNQIINKKVNISTLCLVPSLERSKYMDFSYPVAIESYKLLVPMPEEKSRLLGPIRPFENSVWALLLSSIVSAVALFTIFSRCYYNWTLTFPLAPEPHKSIARNGRRQRTIFDTCSDYTVYTMATLTNQGINILINRDSFRILAALWLLSATVLVNSYSGTLMSSLTVTKFKPAIDSLEDLAKQEKIILTNNAKSIMTETILNSTLSTYKVIADAMRRNPESMYLTPKQGLENIFSLKYAFPTVESYTPYLIDMDLRKTKQCRFHISNRIPMTESYTFGLEKDNKLNQAFNDKLLYLWETGLMQFWVKNNLPQVGKCLVKQKESARQKPIKLLDLTSAFFILGIGGGLALFVFLIELCVSFYLKH